jgi:DNA-binding FadR family transcriptional regulator
MSVPSPAQRVAFARLSGRRKAEAVARQITQAIAIGLLPAGTRLPSEAALAASLGVSNVTVRQALEILRQQGLLETRRGRGGGSFVREASDQTHLPSHHHLNGFDPDELRDISDLHSAIAGTAALLAARRMTRASIPPLRELARAVATATDPVTRVRADARFHIEVAALSRSARLTRAELALQSEVASLLWVPGREAWTPSRAAAEHAKLVRALAAGDADRARAIAEEHVQSGLAHVIAVRMGMIDSEETASDAS